MTPILLEEDPAENMSGILISTVPSDETSNQAFEISLLELNDCLYEYFPLDLYDWMPPVDAIYWLHLVHHLPPTLKALEFNEHASSTAA